MKKVISGKLYDTNTAEELHSWSNGLYYTDFRYLREILYKTKKGNLFLCGEGGALTDYSEAVGNARTGNEDIRSLTREEAAEWLAEHDGEEVLETEFPDLLEEA